MAMVKVIRKVNIMPGYTNKKGRKIWVFDLNDVDKANSLGLDLKDIKPDSYDTYEIMDGYWKMGKKKVKKKKRSAKHGGQIGSGSSFVASLYKGKK